MAGYLRVISPAARSSSGSSRLQASSAKLQEAASGKLQAASVTDGRIQG